MSDERRLFPTEAEFVDFYALCIPASPATLTAINEFCNQWPGLKSIIQELDQWPGSRESLTQRLQLALIGGMQVAFRVRD